MTRWRGAGEIAGELAESRKHAWHVLRSCAVPVMETTECIWHLLGSPSEQTTEPDTQSLRCSPTLPPYFEMRLLFFHEAGNLGLVPSNFAREPATCPLLATPRAPLHNFHNARAKYGPHPPSGT